MVIVLSREDADRTLSTCISKRKEKKNKNLLHSEPATLFIRRTGSIRTQLFYNGWEASSNSVKRDPPNLAVCLADIWW